MPSLEQTVDAKLGRLRYFVSGLGIGRTASFALVDALRAELNPHADTERSERVAAKARELEASGRPVEDGVWIREPDAAEITGTTAATLRKNRCVGRGPPYRKEASGAVWYSLYDLL